MHSPAENTELTGSPFPEGNQNQITVHHVLLFLQNKTEFQRIFF